jgi:type II secretory pathway pseudopilin PulG
MPSETGNWVKFNDHADRVRELEEAVRVYQTALEEIRRGKTHADNVHPLGEYASQAIRYHNIARTAIERVTENPIASDAVKEAGR